MKRGKKIALGVAGFLGIVVIVVVIMMVKFSGQMESLKFTEVEMTKIEDGIYRGTAETLLIQVDTEVIVKDHKITGVKLLRHFNGQGTPAERITDEMLKNNTWKVDDVSGATASSEVIKSAVSNALAGGKKE